VLARDGSELADRLAGRHLAEALMAVDDERRAPAPGDLGGGGGVEPAVADVLQVRREAADAVRVVPAQVGLHERLGDDRGGVRRRARALEHLAGEVQQIFSAVNAFHVAEWDSL
jgi:hypothetical protein